MADPAVEAEDNLVSAVHDQQRGRAFLPSRIGSTMARSARARSYFRTGLGFMPTAELKVAWMGRAGAGFPQS